MITIDDYKNQSTNPHLVKGFVENIPTEVQIRKQLSDNLSKGLIDQDVYNKAIDQLENLLVKGGEGSRGGHIIGHTKSGKPIYSNADHSSHKDFTVEDHNDAIDAHGKVRENYHYNTRSTAKDKEDNDYAFEQQKHHIGVKNGLLQKSDSDLDLIKAKSGEGSRGGHVIGHTSSGKPIYADGKIGGGNLSSKDYSDAATAHRDKAARHFDTAGKVGYAARDLEMKLHKHHADEAKYHDTQSQKYAQSEHESSLSKDEKKILADQKKKQIEHHSKMEAFHTRMAGHATKEAFGVGFDKEQSNAAQEAFKYHQSQAQHHFQKQKELGQK
jgi:hypothetical protein